MHTLSQNVKIVQCAQEVKNNGHPTLTYVDTAGFKKATFFLMLGATDVAVDMNVGECATTGGSYAAITASDITQLANTDDNKIVAVEVDLTKSRLQYLKPSITCGSSNSGASVAAFCLLSQADAAPVAVADAGIKERIAV